MIAAVYSGFDGRLKRGGLVRDCLLILLRQMIEINQIVIGKRGGTSERFGIPALIGQLGKAVDRQLLLQSVKHFVHCLPDDIDL